MRHSLLTACLSLFCCLFFLQPACSQELDAVTPMTMGTYFSSFDGTSIYYEVEGQGPAVILLHGFTNTLQSWKDKPIYQELIQNGFTVVALDLRVNGNSDKPATVAGYEGDAEALAKLMPKATAKRVPGEHNTAHQSQEFAQEVLRFLQKNRR